MQEHYFDALHNKANAIVAILHSMFANDDPQARISLSKDLLVKAIILNSFAEAHDNAGSIPDAQVTAFEQLELAFGETSKES